MIEKIKTYFSSFSEPIYFWLLLLLPLLTAYYFIRKKNSRSTIKISSVAALNIKSYKNYLQHFVFALQLVAISLIIFALARPQSNTKYKTINTEGIDIMLSLDISASMLAQDFKPNRLSAAKVLSSEFILQRPNDRVGLVIFSGESFTQSPLTSDHKVIVNMFQNIQTGMIEDGTAIGMGLANAVARIKDSKAKSKVIILLTDGVNNAGTVAPLTAAEIAKTFGVRVYTIGVGTTGKALSPVSINALGEFQYDYVDVKIDEPLMKQIASMTGGKYFRATDNESLKTVYNEIDKLEKTIFEENSYTEKAEDYFNYALIAGLLLLMEFTVRTTILKSAA